MRATLLRGLVVLALASAPLMGCYVDADYPVTDEGWEPQYYDGYVVYYDGVGRPFYYVGGAAVWVPYSSPFYARYHEYWRGHSYAYNRWHTRYGARFHSYRSGGGGHRR